MPGEGHHPADRNACSAGDGWVQHGHVPRVRRPEVDEGERHQLEGEVAKQGERNDLLGPVTSVQRDRQRRDGEHQYPGPVVGPDRIEHPGMVERGAFREDRRLDACTVRDHRSEIDLRKDQPGNDAGGAPREKAPGHPTGEQQVGDADGRDERSCVQLVEEIEPQQDSAQRDPLFIQRDQSSNAEGGSQGRLHPAQCVDAEIETAQKEDRRNDPGDEAGHPAGEIGHECSCGGEGSDADDFRRTDQPAAQVADQSEDERVERRTRTVCPISRVVREATSMSDPPGIAKRDGGIVVEHNPDVAQGDDERDGCDEGCDQGGRTSVQPPQPAPSWFT